MGCTARECGHEPLQFYWLWSAVKLTANGMLKIPVVSLCIGLSRQISICSLTHSSTYWTAQLLRAFQGLHDGSSHVRAVQTGHAITMQAFTADSKV